MTKLDVSEIKNPIRADLWQTMTLTELHKQRDLVVEELTRVRSIQFDMGQSHPTIRTLLRHLESAFQQITYLIDNYGQIQKKANEQN